MPQPAEITQFIFGQPLRITQIEGQTFRAELTVNDIVYVANGFINVEKNGDVKFGIEGEASFLATILEWSLELIKNVFKELICGGAVVYTLVYLLNLQNENDNIKQFFARHDITPLSATVGWVKIVIFLNVIFWATKIGISIYKSRISSKKAGETIEAWLGVTEQALRQEGLRETPKLGNSIP